MRVCVHPLFLPCYPLPPTNHRTLPSPLYTYTITPPPLYNNMNQTTPQVAFWEVVRELFLETFWYGDGVFLMDTEHFRRRLLSNIGNYTFQARRTNVILV